MIYIHSTVCDKKTLKKLGRVTHLTGKGDMVATIEQDSGKAVKRKISSLLPYPNDQECRVLKQIRVSGTAGKTLGSMPLLTKMQTLHGMKNKNWLVQDRTGNYRLTKFATTILDNYAAHKKVLSNNR